MTLHSGKLNRRITIQYRERVMDEYGQETLDNWQDLCHVWAWVKSASGVSSLPTSDGVGRDITRYSFRIRYNVRVKADMRILYQGNIFSIREVLHDIAGHEYTDITANLGGSST